MLIEQSWIHTIAWTLLHASWQIAILGIIYAIFKQIFRNSNPQLRYTSALLSLIAIPIWVGITFWQHMPETPIIAEQILAISQNTLQGVVELPSETIAPIKVSTEALSTGFEERFNQAAPWLSLLWLIGIICMGIRFILGVLKLNHLRGKGLDTLPLSLQDQALTLANRMGLKKISIKVSSAIDQPISLGYFKPLVLLPTGMLTGLSPKQVEAILAHEFAHLLRNDFLINLFQSLVEVFFFFHPVVWWLSKEIRQERELCCDDLALTYLEDTYTYAEALAQLQVLRRRPRLALAARGGNFSARIQRLFGAKSKASYWKGLVAAGIMVSSLMIGGFLTYQQLSDYAQKEFSQAEVQDLPIKSFGLGGFGWEVPMQKLKDYLNWHDIMAYPSYSVSQGRMTDFGIIYYDGENGFLKAGIKKPGEFLLEVDPNQHSINFIPTQDGEYYSQRNLKSSFVEIGPKDNPEAIAGLLSSLRQDGGAWELKGYNKDWRDQLRSLDINWLGQTKETKLPARFVYINDGKKVLTDRIETSYKNFPTKGVKAVHTSSSFHQFAPEGPEEAFYTENTISSDSEDEGDFEDFGYSNLEEDPIEEGWMTSPGPGNFINGVPFSSMRNNDMYNAAFYQADEKTVAILEKRSVINLVNLVFSTNSMVNNTYLMTLDYYLNLRTKTPTPEMFDINTVSKELLEFLPGIKDLDPAYLDYLEGKELFMITDSRTSISLRDMKFDEFLYNDQVYKYPFHEWGAYRMLSKHFEAVQKFDPDLQKVLREKGEITTTGILFGSGLEYGGITPELVYYMNEDFKVSYLAENPNSKLFSETHLSQESAKELLKNVKDLPQKLIMDLVGKELTIIETTHQL